MQVEKDLEIIAFCLLCVFYKASQLFLLQSGLYLKVLLGTSFHLTAILATALGSYLRLRSQRLLFELIGREPELLMVS